VEVIRPDQGVARASVSVLAVGLLALAAGSVPAVAAEPSPVVEEARRLYAEGLQRYKDGAYDEAIEKLNASYLRVPAPGLLYDLAQAQRLKGDCQRALALYRQYLASPGTDAVRTFAAERAAEMEACLATRAVAPSSPATAPVSPAIAPALPATTTASPATASLAPPPVRRAPEPAVPIVVAGAASEGSGGTRAARRRRSTWAWGIATAVLTATTGYFAWRTAEMSDRVSGIFVPGSTFDGAAMDAQTNGQTSEKLELAAGACAIVAGGITVWLWLRDR
jgi:hypothetical protein